MILRAVPDEVDDAAFDDPDMESFDKSSPRSSRSPLGALFFEVARHASTWNLTSIFSPLISYGKNPEVRYIRLFLGQVTYICDNSMVACTTRAIDRNL